MPQITYADLRSGTEARGLSHPRRPAPEAQKHCSKRSAFLLPFQSAGI